MTAQHRIVVASRNAHKVAEIQALLSDLPVKLVTIDEVAPGVLLREDEPTFEGNALAKAHQAARATGMLAMADDSGLEVDMLGGEPGVWSARYAGLPSDDERNNAKLLRELVGVPAPERTARYRCCAVFVDLDNQQSLVEFGACEGQILSHRQGSGGFGYDPLFFLPALGKTMAEITLEEKNSFSHRSKAFRALAKALRSYLASLSVT
jgi:XTP/dITP diphosphohydrolase